MLLSCFSPVRLCAIPETAAHQAPLSLGFSRQEHWSGLPFPTPMHESEKWKWSRAVVSDSVRPHGLRLFSLPSQQPTPSSPRPLPKLICPELNLKTHDCSLGFNLTMNLMLGKGTGAHWRKPGEARIGASPSTIHPEEWPRLQTGAPPPLPVDWGKEDPAAPASGLLRHCSTCGLVSLPVAFAIFSSGERPALMCVYIYIHIYIYICIYTYVHYIKCWQLMGFPQMCFKSLRRGTSLVVQQLRPCTLNAGVLGLILSQGTRSCMPQWRSHGEQLRFSAAKLNKYWEKIWQRINSTDEEKCLE